MATDAYRLHQHNDIVVASCDRSSSQRGIITEMSMKFFAFGTRLDKWTRVLPLPAMWRLPTIAIGYRDYDPYIAKHSGEHYLHIVMGR